MILKTIKMCDPNYPNIFSKSIVYAKTLLYQLAKPMQTIAYHVLLAKNEEFSTVITNQDHNYRFTNQEVTLISFWLLISNKSSPRMSIKQLDEKNHKIYALDVKEHL